MIVSSIVGCTEILIDLINVIHAHKFISLSNKLNERTRKTAAVTVVVVSEVALQASCWTYMLITGF